MSTTVIVELYHGNAPGIEGIPLEEWSGTLDAETIDWLTSLDWGVDPDLWVNIVAAGTWTPNNYPLAERPMTVPASTMAE